MLGKYVKLVLVVVLATAIVSCGKPAKSQNDTIEDQLIKSFKDENPNLKQHIAEIVKEAKDGNYQKSLNKLALLSTTRLLTKKQKQAVDTLIRQLLYDLEEKILSEKKSSGVRGE